MAWWVWTCWVGAGVFGVGALGVLYVALLRDRSRGRRRCPRCWYDMGGVPGLRCPECGREARREKSHFRTRRRWGLAAAAMGLLAVAYAGWVTPGVVKTGKWWTAVPRPVLAVVVQFWDDGEMSLLRHLAPLEGTDSLPLTKVERLLVAQRCAAILEGPPYLVCPPAPGTASLHDAACAVLECLGREGWPANEVMVRRLDVVAYSSPWIALGIAAREDPEVLDALEGLLSSLHAETALTSLSWAGPKARSVWPEIVAVMNRPGPYGFAWSAAVALAEIGPTKDAVDAFEQGLAMGDERTKLAAVRGISSLLLGSWIHIGTWRPAMATALPPQRPPLSEEDRSRIATVLGKAARDPLLRAPRECAAAISRLGPQGVPLLAELVIEKDSDLAAECASRLAELGAVAAPAVSSLAIAARRSSSRSQAEAVMALARIGRHVPEARNAFGALLMDTDPSVRALAGQVRDQFVPLWSHPKE